MTLDCNLLTIQVKDRFCSLLSQQISELQKKVNKLQNDSVDKVGMNSEESTSVSTENMPITEVATHIFIIYSV